MPIRAACVLLAACSLAFATMARAETVLRVGMFPNLTHAQALVASSFSQEGTGWFETRLGGDIRIEWFVFNAGPSAMEAFFTKAVDLTYVGPSPALNAYVRSNGREVRVVAGALRGGTALVARKNIRSVEELRGKMIATPQLGNTQDVECRAWLIRQGFHITLTGGDARVVPAANPDILMLMRQGRIDAAWTVEAWVTRLLNEADAHILHSSPSSITTVLTVRADFLEKNRDLTARFVAAHRELTQWIRDNPDEAQQRVQKELSRITRSQIPMELVREAWTRLIFDADISLPPFEDYIKDARLVGFLRAQVDLSKFVDPLP